MRVPLEMAARVLRARTSTPFALAERLAMTGTEVERVEHHGVDALENFVVGKVLEAERTPTPTGSASAWSTPATASPRQIVCGAPNVAAGQTVAVARPGAVMPDGTKLKVAKLRGQASNGMILAEDEVAIGTDHDGIMVLDDGAGAGHAAGRRCCRSPPTCWCSRSPRTGPTASASTGSPARCTPPPARRWRRRRGPRTRGVRRRRSTRRRDHRRVPRPVPAVHRPRVRGREDRALAGVAEGAADGRRPAADLQRRRHHQLRDAAHRPAAARVRPRPHRRRAAHRPPRPRRRDGADARRPDARRWTPTWC